MVRGNGKPWVQCKKEKAKSQRDLALAAGEGFEPSHTESESAVLPLHNPAKSFVTGGFVCVPPNNMAYYSRIQRNVNSYFKSFFIFLRIFSFLPSCGKIELK